MDRHPNSRLDELIADRGFTHASLAAEINQVLAEIYGRPGDCTDRHIRRWINGDVRWPWTRYLLALQQIFDLPPQALGFVPRGKDSAHLPVPPQSAASGTRPVHRRQVIAVSAAASVALALGVDQTPVRGRLAMTDIDRVHERIGRLDAHFTAIGGAHLVEVSTAYIDRLRDSLDGCTYGVRVERALHGAISSLYAAAGWAARDAGDARHAAGLHAASLQSALLAADPQATARAWSDLALQARTEGRHREAVQINRAALDNRRLRADPRISALLHARLAIGQARIGDPAAAGRCLLAAQQNFDKADKVPAPAWLAFLTPAELSGLAAITHQALGQYARAEADTVQALSLLPASMRRNRAYYSVQLAELQLAQNNIDQAAATATGIQRGTITSRRITGRLDNVTATLDRRLGGPHR